MAQQLGQYSVTFQFHLEYISGKCVVFICAVRVQIYLAVDVAAVMVGTISKHTPRRMLWHVVEHVWDCSNTVMMEFDFEL